MYIYKSKAIPMNRQWRRMLPVRYEHHVHIPYQQPGPKSAGAAKQRHAPEWPEPRITAVLLRDAKNRPRKQAPRILTLLLKQRINPRHHHSEKITTSAHRFLCVSSDFR
jgi:hypothetical protein